MKGGDKVPAAKLPTESDAVVPAQDNPPASNNLTPEEQMARYEQELKENDWGHQPC